MLDAIDYAADKGTVVVFAAGNDGSDGAWYPAFYAPVVAVAATNNDGVAAYFTNYGSWVDISAPGYPVSRSLSPQPRHKTDDDGGQVARFVFTRRPYNLLWNLFTLSPTPLYPPQVLSTVTVAEGSYGSYSGTSMACPLVAGVLALGKAHRPDATSADLKACLLSSAVHLAALNDASYAGGLGAGLVHAAAFLACLGGGAPTSSPTRTLRPTAWRPPPPTRTPTACACDAALTLRVATDQWPAESSYQLTAADPCHTAGQVCPVVQLAEQKKVCRAALAFLANMRVEWSGQYLSF